MKKLVSALALALCVTAPAQAAEELVYQSFWAPAHQLNKEVIEPWCQGMEKATDGKYVLQYNALNAQVKVNAVAGAVRNGALDVGGIQMQTAIAMMPLSQLISMPFLVRNAEEACILYSKMYETFPEMQAEAEKNFKLLAAVASDRYAFVSKDGLIKTPADLQGKRVIIWSANLIEEVKSWGGIPVETTSTETYMGLQRGLGDVAYVPAPAVEMQKLSEVGKFITLISSTAGAMTIVVNHDVWDSLDESGQKYLVESTGPALSQRLGQGLVAITDGDMKKAEAKGCTVYELSLEEQNLFRDAAAQAHHEYWVDMLSRNKVKDPEGWIRKARELAATTFNRQ